MSTNNKKAALIILDGWGIGKKDESNALHIAKTPFVDELLANNPNAQLLTHGGNVGLPDGQMGNSEVGHLNIGAGRVVFQELARINNAIADKSFFENLVLLGLLKEAQEKGRLHLMGLVSDGGVHSHINHLKALIDAAHLAGVKDTFIHAFTDGRDCDPNSGNAFLNDIEDYCSKRQAKLVSVVGRYYAMDRDLRWERVAKAYNLLVKGEADMFSTAQDAVLASYNKDVTDEFIEPSVIGDEAKLIQDGDVVICFNFRTDRCREITRALTQEDMPEHGMNKLNLTYATMTRYDDSYERVQVMFEKDNIDLPLGEYLSLKGLSQLRIAETEKYPHVTFFFNGGREEPYTDESRIMVNSPKVATYDLQPEMSAPEVSQKVCQHIEEHTPNFICLNFANTDMVGHTGVKEAVIAAAETVDACLKEVVSTAIKHDYQLVIIADHGNADKIINEDGSPHTAHTLNPVPVILVNSKYPSIENGILADVAPTIIKLLGLEQPVQMTGKALV